MSISGFGRHALGIGLPVLMVAGCGGSRGQLEGTGAMPQAPAMVAHAEHGKSRIKPGSSSGDLLYVTANEEVYIFTYPGGTQVGTLTGFNGLAGLCSDIQGNVWIANDLNGSYGSGEMIEYAHGGTSPVATLSDSEAPVACSVDATTGNLATSNDGSTLLGIYKNAQGSPTFYPYVLSGPLDPDSVTYDSAGNVFIVGWDWDGAARLLKRASGYEHHVAWLPKGASGVEKFGLKAGYTIREVFWDGSYLAGFGVKGWFRYRVQKKRGIKVGAPISIKGWDGGPFWIQGSTFIASTQNAVSFWHYPTGGDPYQTISADDAYGVTVSVAPSPGSHSRKKPKTP